MSTFCIEKQGGTVAETADTRKETRLEVLLLLLMGIVILLMVAIIGPFIRMNQLQSQVLAATGSFQAMGVPEGLEIATEAPDFSLPDIEGRMVSLKDFAGKQVMVVFSSVHCPACVELLPELKEFSEKHPAEVQVVMISRGTGEENRRLVEGESLNFPVLAWDDTVARDYRVQGTPFFYVIDGEGVITNKGFANTLLQLEALVEVRGK
ncbi:MAG: TlpA family protein disulfide reductase [Chloroflexi bacterium]|nr:TlpA family protein disulfide reductase [Chloroflexota bacterium]